MLKVEKQEILSIYVYALFNGIISLSLPLGIQAIINLITGGQISTSWILLVCLVIIGIALSGAMQIMQLIITENLQQKIFTRSAFEFAFRIPKIKLEAIGKYHLPELVNRFFDTLSVQKGLSKILMDFSTASLQVVFGLILLSMYHPFFILFSVLLLASLYLVFKLTWSKGLSTSITESKHKYEVAHWLEEMARTMETFKMAGNTPMPLNKTDEFVSHYLGARKKHFKTLLTQYINLVGFKVLVAAGLLIIGGLLVLNQKMNIGQFVASEIIIILILASVEKLIVSMETIYDVLTAIDKIGAFTDIPLQRSKGRELKLEGQRAVNITITDLIYQYPNLELPTLRGISLDITAGSKIAIAGNNASGKSTLLHLVSGFYEKYEGAITYNNIPLTNINIASLHSIIGDNLSKEEIFKSTFAENISLGRPNISFDDINAAIKVLNLTPYINKLPNGIDTEVIPEGKDLSKSVRLKIMLARAIVGQPKLLLLDDNFNQLLPSDKSAFLQHLLQMPCTVIAITNDLEVAKLFDYTVALENGSILEQDRAEKMKKITWSNSYPDRS
jgi:ABC-type bacteriocin/lantibiotic exporter with double-glycine peptidase domain